MNLWDKIKINEKKNNGLKLFEWQKRFIKWAVVALKNNPAGIYLNADVGTGKTIATLALLAKKKPSKVVVVAPLSAHFAWKTENSKYFNLNLEIRTYEKVARDNKLPSADFYVFDEAHRLKNPKAKVVRVAWKLDKPKILLSGTPQDREWELYSQYRCLGLWKGETWGRWVRSRYFLNIYNRPERPLSPSIPFEIRKEIKPLTFRCRIEDVTELPQLVEEIIELPKNTRLASAIKKQKEENIFTVTNFMREYALIQGVDTESDKIVSDYKIRWVIEFLKDNPDTIVFSLFKRPVRAIQAKMKGEAYYVTGEDKSSLKSILDANTEVKPIIATYSLKEGINLQGKYRKIIFLTLPLAYRDLHQAKGRVYRSGQKKRVVIYYLLSKFPLEQRVYKLLKDKKDVYDFFRKDGNGVTNEQEI